MLVILVAQEFRRHSGEKPKGNDADDLGCVSDLGGRIVFENAQWRNVNNNGDLDVLVIWVAKYFLKMHDTDVGDLGGRRGGRPPQRARDWGVEDLAVI